MRSFKDRRKRDKGVSPYDAGPEEGEDKKKQKQKQEDEDFRHVMKKVAAAIEKGEDGGGVAGVEQWSVGALKRWLTRSGVMHNDSYERSELVGRVLQRWLGMTSAEKQSASEAARREMNNEGGAWWRESKEKDATKPAPAEAPSPAPVPSTPKKDAGRADAAEAAKQAFNERADKWFKENHGTDNHGRVGATPPGAANSGTSYAEDRAREREARAEKAARDKMAADKEEAEAWEKEKAKRKATAAEREMEAQAKAAAAAAKQRQEREWCAAVSFCIAYSEHERSRLLMFANRKRQAEHQKQRNSAQEQREAELERQKAQYQRELERRMAKEREQNEAAQREHEARQRSTNAAHAAARAKEDRMRAQQRHQAEEAEKQRRRRAAAAQAQAAVRTPPPVAAATVDGIRVGGGERVDAELERKQEERVRELRAAERKKEREAQQMAGVQKRVDGAPLRPFRCTAISSATETTARGLTNALGRGRRGGPLVDAQGSAHNAPHDGPYLARRAQHERRICRPQEGLHEGDSAGASGQGRSECLAAGEGQGAEDLHHAPGEQAAGGAVACCFSCFRGYETGLGLL